MSNNIEKFEKDAQEKQIVADMIKTVGQLRYHLGIEDITEYYTERMSASVSSDGDNAYTMDYIDNAINVSARLLNANIKLFLLLEKHNQLTGKEVSNG